MMSSMLPLLEASRALSFSNDRTLGGNERDHFELGDALDVVNGQDVQWIGHRQEQLIIEARNGDDFVIVGQVAREQFGHFGKNADARKIDRRSVENAAHRDRHVLLADVGFFDDELQQPRAFFLLLLQQLFHLRDRQQAVLDEGVGYAFSK